MLLQVVASLLLATAAPAPLETGDVLAGTAIGGCYPEGCGVSPGYVVRGDGVVKQTIHQPVWGHGVSELLAQPDRVLFTGFVLDSAASVEVIVSTDIRTITDRWLRPLGLWWKLSNIVPMRSGDFLVAESSHFSRLVRFDASGNVVAVYMFPAEQYVRGARLIELLSDQCTVVWVPEIENRADASIGRTLRAFDICKNAPVADLFRMPVVAMAIPRIIRQLPDGGFVIVTDQGTQRLDASGAQIAVYPVKPHNGFALTPDGHGFWSADDFGELLRINFAAPDVVVRRIVLEPGNVHVMGVVGEWRASLQPPPPPPPPSRRRSVRR